MAICPVLLFAILILSPNLASAAVSFDCKFEKGQGSQASPFSYASNAGTVTCTPAANSNRVLICNVVLNNITSSAVSVTWNSVSMTQIGTATNNGRDNYLFGLINPASGSQTISASWTGGSANPAVIGCWMLYNADQSTGWQNFNSATGTSTAPSLTVTSANGNLAVASVADSNATSGTISSGTSDWNERAWDGNYEGGHAASSGSSTVLSWTLGSSVAWVEVGVDVIASGGGGGGATPAVNIKRKKVTILDSI